MNDSYTLPFIVPSTGVTSNIQDNFGHSTLYFYKNKLYKNIEAEKPGKLKNMRICRG